MNSPIPSIRNVFMLCILITVSQNIYAQTSALDVSFANNGIAITPLGINNEGKAIVIQSDGKLLVGGYVDNGLNSGYDFSLIRYNTNGSLDSTFDFDGIVMTDVGNLNDYAMSVAIQTDGKIILAGYSENIASMSFANDIAVVRYNTNGSLDTTFGSSGKVTTSISIYNDFGFSVAIQTDGKIVVAGYNDVPSISDMLLVRYNTNGVLDSTFDADGIVTTSFGTLGDVAYSMALQQDGKIVVTGFSNNGTNLDIALARYNTNGSLDTTFDGDGKVITSIGNSSSTGTFLLVQNDSKLVVSGFIDNGIKKDILLIRYLSNGSLDMSFDTDGIVTTTIGTESDISNSIAIQTDGKIIVGGYTTSNTNSDFCLTRYTIIGALDSSLDLDGIITTPIGVLGDYGASLKVQSDGKIVLVGTSFSGTSPKLALVRYNNSNPVGISDNVVCKSGITYYPNPFSAITTLNSKKTLINATLNVYNSFGQKIKIMNKLNGETVIFKRENLPIGLYHFELKQGNEIIAKNELVILD